MKPYFETDNGVIYKGHVLEVLSGMASESVHCVITSPPYWGLRDYGIEPQIWDGKDVKCNGNCHFLDNEKIEADPSCLKHGLAMCKHEWVSNINKNPNAGGGAGLNRNRDGDYRKNGYESQFCRHCNAWRGSLGLEPSLDLYVSHLVQIFSEVKRVLHKSGCVWVNLGDSYASSPAGNKTQTEFAKRGGRYRTDNYRKDVGQDSGLKPKDLCMIPARVAIALQADGWYLRSAMPWVKRSAMPESVTDRPASALEHVFLLSKSPKYYFDMDAVRQKQSDNPETINRYKYKPGQKSGRTDGLSNPTGNFDDYQPSTGRNYRNTDLFYESIKPPHGMIFAGDEPVGLDVNPQGFPEAHFATFSPKIPEICIKAGTSEKGCCPECGEPWLRVVEKTKYEPPAAEIGERFVDESRGDKNRKLSGKDYNEQTQSKTTGWKPGCECDQRNGIISDCEDPSLAPYRPIPCTVLDPFLGSGTVAIVAHKLRRKWIGIELNPEYCEMAKKRIMKSMEQRRLF